MATSIVIGMTATALVAVVGVLIWRSREWLARLSWGSVIVGAGAGAAAMAATSLLWTTHAQTPTSRENDVFRSLALPEEPPPGLTEVRVQNSSTNGLEMYVMHGTVSILVCYATPGELDVGSCTQSGTQLIRELKNPGGDNRVERIVRFQALKEDETKVSSTVDADAVINYWRETALVDNPAWLNKWLD